MVEFQPSREYQQLLSKQDLEDALNECLVSRPLVLDTLQFVSERLQPEEDEDPQNIDGLISCLQTLTKIFKVHREKEGE